MRRLLLVANPAASGFTGGLFRNVAALLAAGFEIEPAWPVNPGEAKRVTSEAAADGVDIVVAFGGDGVVHHVANGLAETGTALGIIPAGTTNVLARILGVPDKPKKAAELLLNETAATPQPLAKVELTGQPSAHFATFSAGVGYDAEVVERSEAQPYRKYWFGSVHYARSAVAALLQEFRTRAPNLYVSDGVRKAHAVSVLTQVHSPYTYFGRVPLGVTGSGALTAIVLEHLPVRRAPSILLRAVQGANLEKIRGIQVWRSVKKLWISADPDEVVQADGELLGRTGDYAVTFVENGLLVVVPRTTT